MGSRIREALEWYADEMNYFPRTLIRLAQEKHIQLAPVYSEFGEKAREALAILDAPVASDAREVALSVPATFGEASTPGYHFFKMDDQPGSNEASAIIESFAADRERKAREETARKCAEAAVKFFDLDPTRSLADDVRAAIMEAAHE